MGPLPLIATSGICVVGTVQGGRFVPKDNDPGKFTRPPGWKAAT